MNTKPFDTTLPFNSPCGKFWTCRTRDGSTAEFTAPPALSSEESYTLIGNLAGEHGTWTMAGLFDIYNAYSGKNLDFSTLTYPPDVDGWIPWHGGECPVDEKLTCEIRTRDGCTRPYERMMNIGNSWWNHEQGCRDLDIIAYRIVQPRAVTVALGPEDVPPGSVVRGHDFSDGCWSVVHGIGEDCVFVNDDEAVSFEAMKYDNWLINRSLSRGAWDATAWEKCEKEEETK